MLRHAVAAVAILAAAGPAAAQQNPSFNVVNRTPNVISELYASAAGQTNWGRDRLQQQDIAPGAYFAVRLPADGNCTYDIRVVYANGASDERRNLNTCTLDNVIFPGAGATPGRPAGRSATTDDPSFRLVNRGRSGVSELYASLPSDGDWGEDRLGDDTIAAGASKMIRLPNGQCLYDIRIVYANGEATEKRRVNLCTITDMRVP